MNQYQKTTEKKKQAIIQSALSLFKEKGFKETSIQSIAKVAEVSPVSIYNYFDKKDNYEKTTIVIDRTKYFATGILAIYTLVFAALYVMRQVVRKD